MKIIKYIKHHKYSIVLWTAGILLMIFNLTDSWHNIIKFALWYLGCVCVIIGGLVYLLTPINFNNKNSKP